MLFPLSLSDISLFIGILSIFLLITAELVYANSELLNNLAINKTRLRQASLVTGALFVVTIILRIGLPELF